MNFKALYFVDKVTLLHRQQRQTKASNLLSLKLKSMSKSFEWSSWTAVWLTSLIYEAGRLPDCYQPVWKPWRCFYCTGPWFPAGPRSGLLRKRPSSSPCSPRNWTHRRWCGLTVDCNRRRSRWAPLGRSSRTFPLWWGPGYKRTVWSV